jgi:hypothetical protein
MLPDQVVVGLQEDESIFDPCLGKPVPFCHPLTEVQWIIEYAKTLDQSGRNQLSSMLDELLAV